MDMSFACARPTSGPLRGLIVISALWRCFSTARMTLVSNLSPRILRILVRPVSTSLRMALVTSYCLPVYSTFMSAPPFQFGELKRALHFETFRCRSQGLKPHLLVTGPAWLTPCPSTKLFFYSSLVSARNAHVFAVLGYRAAGHLNALRLQDAGDLLVGQRTSWIFFFDELFDTALEDQ